MSLSNIGQRIAPPETGLDYASRYRRQYIISALAILRDVRGMGTE
jgi:hypothetical protein